MNRTQEKVGVNKVIYRRVGPSRMCECAQVRAVYWRRCGIDVESCEQVPRVNYVGGSRSSSPPGTIMVIIYFLLFLRSLE